MCYKIKLMKYRRLLTLLAIATALPSCNLFQRKTTTVNLKRCIVVLLTVLTLILGACGSKQTAEAIQPNTTDTPASTPIPMTAAPDREPTAAQVLVVEPQTPVPTLTPMPSPTPSPTPLPTDTPSPTMPPR